MAGAHKNMQKYTKAKSMQVMVENKTEKAIAAISGIGAAVAVKNGPFEKEWIEEICSALRKCVDTLEVDLLKQHERKKPFRLQDNSLQNEPEGA